MVRFIHVRATRLAPALQTTAVRNRATRSCRRTPGSSRWVLTGTRGIVRALRGWSEEGVEMTSAARRG